MQSSCKQPPRVFALKSLKASNARLGATRLGREVGDRTTLELLNAESDAAAAELGLVRARIGLLLDRLRLAALAGALDEQLVVSVNDSINRTGTP
jgi:outer membrane protein